jgi:hypothetical protein
MHLARLFLFILFIGLPLTAVAELNGGDFPVARWYAHVDLVQMRSSDAGKELYAWLEDEVFDELRDEIGFDADQEANVITALATPDSGMVVIIDGDFSQKTEDRIVAVGAAASDFNMLEHDGKTYYQIEEESDDPDRNSFDNGAFLSVAIKNKLIMTSSEEQMQQIFSSNGRIPGDYDNDGALIVLRGEKSFVQAGMQTNEMGDDLGWDSNMLRNTEQLALLVSDQKGLLAVEAQLIANEEEMANSLASIVRGLISLAAFNDELDPELTAFLNGTTVDVDGSTLTVKVAMDPEVLVNAID